MDDPSFLDTINYVDIVAGMCLVFGMVVGFRRGLSGELARLISLGVAVVAGWQLYEPLGNRIVEFTRLSERGSFLVGFLLSFVAFLLLAVLVRWGLKHLMEFSFKGPLEKVGGAVAGFLRCFALVSAVILAAALSPIGYLERAFGEESRIGRVVTHVLLPAYQRVSETRPDLGLPALPEPQPPGGNEDRGSDRPSERE